MLPYLGFSKAGEIHPMFPSAENLLLWSYDNPSPPSTYVLSVNKGSLLFLQYKDVSNCALVTFDFRTLLCLITFRFRLSTPGLFPL